MKEQIKDKKLYCIVNPGAGGGTSRLWWEKTMPELDRHGYKYSWEYMHPGHVRQQVRTAVLDQRAEIVVVVGGDGSIFEVINAIVENGTLIKEGLIVAVAPSGSACDFARHIHDNKRAFGPF